MDRTQTRPIPMPGRLPVSMNNGLVTAALTEVPTGRQVTATGVIAAAHGLPGARFNLVVEGTDRATAVATVPARVMLAAVRVNGGPLPVGARVSVTGIVARRHPGTPATIDALSVRGA